MNTTKTFNAAELGVCLYSKELRLPVIIVNLIFNIGIQKQPVQWSQMDPQLRAKYMERHFTYVNSSNGPASTHTKSKNIDNILKFIRSVNKNNCKKFAPDDLVLHGDIGFGTEQQFENEARMALRLANFISSFLQVTMPINSELSWFYSSVHDWCANRLLSEYQVVDPTEVFSGNRVADRALNEDQMMAETLALVLGNTRIWGAGTFWERRKFPNRTLFAPYAYKENLNTRKFKMEDLARLNSTGKFSFVIIILAIDLLVCFIYICFAPRNNRADDLYLNKEWYQHLKSRWATNFDDLEKYYLKIRIRSEENADHTQKYEHFPIFYRYYMNITFSILVLIKCVQFNNHQSC